MLFAGSYPSQNWNYTAHSLIDTSLTNIVATIVGLAEGKHTQEAERCRLAYEEARTRYESLITALNEELCLVEKLFRSANQLRRANHLREFIDSFEQKAEEDHALTSDKQQ